MIDLITAIGAMDPVQAACSAAIIVALIFAISIGIYKSVEAVAGIFKKK